MPSVDTLLSVARGQIGYSRWDDSETGTKYGRWYAEKYGPAWLANNGVPYCAMFVSWVFDRAGVKVEWLPDTYCPNIHDRIESADDDYSSKNAEPGDVVLFDWQRDGEDDHVGIVEENTGSYLVTIEGNTSSGSSGSQGNGGKVARRTRSYAVTTIIGRPDFSADARWVSSKDGKSWWYDHGDGTYATSWEKIDGEWYFFDGKGYMVTGWLKRGKKWYYLAGSGRMITGWQQVGKDWSLLGADGAMLTGWQKPKDDWYLLDDEGRMLTGWQERGGEWYYLSTAHDGSYGHMVTGALPLHGDTYVLAPDGRMLHDCVAVAGGKAYLLGPKGDAAKGSVTLTAGDDGALAAHA